MKEVIQYYEQKYIDYFPFAQLFNFVPIAALSTKGSKLTVEHKAKKILALKSINAKDNKIVIKIEAIKLGARPLKGSKLTEDEKQWRKQFRKHLAHPIYFYDEMDNLMFMHESIRSAARIGSTTEYKLNQCILKGLLFLGYKISKMPLN